MTKQLVTLVLDSPQVGLKEFAEAVQEFRALIEALSKEHAHDTSIEWVLDSLVFGSATAVARGVPQKHEDMSVVETVVDAYENVGRKAREHRLDDLTPLVRRHAKRLVGIVNGKIPAIRLETETEDFEIRSFESVGLTYIPDIPQRISFGAVTGRIQALSNRQGLRFTLYDMSTDKAISCYLAVGSEQKMRDAWGHLAVVEGEVRRDPISGQIQSVRKVASIEIIQEGFPGDFRAARGAITLNEPSEDVIRRMRDNW